MYIGVILILLILKFSEIKNQPLEKILPHNCQLQVTNNLLVVFFCSRKNYQALLRLYGYIDDMDRDADARSDRGRWKTNVYKCVYYILFIQILKVGRIQNHFKFDSGKRIYTLQMYVQTVLICSTLGY